MTVRRLEDIPPLNADLPGVTVRLLKQVEDIELKVMDVEPITSTPYHTHRHAHAALIVTGTGVLRIESGDQPLSAGDVFSVAPGESHAIVSHGPDPLRLICLDCFV